MKHILIHGATNSSNFGDVLFAKLFYDKCREQNLDADFLQIPKYGIGSFTRKETGYSKRLSFREQLKTDGLIMMSGGYMGQNIVSFKRVLRFWLRYILPMLVFSLAGKPIYFLGVGGGPLLSTSMRKALVFLLNRASVIYVRDEETRDYFLQYGVKKDIIVTSDTAQVLADRKIPDASCIDEINRFFGESKILFLHTVKQPEYDKKIAGTVVPALNCFLEEHKEYGVIVGSDEEYADGVIEALETVKALKCDKVYYFHYHSLDDLCSVLKRSDTVITMKLHVGIVSSTFGCAVVSFPIHREKTQRYYRQIGEEERSIHIYECTVDRAQKQLEQYYDKPISLSTDIIEKANRNLQFIEEL